MNMTRYIIEFVFSAALFINAVLFALQTVHIYREKNAKGISLVYFFGMLMIQLTMLLHGLIKYDYLLVYGTIASMVACSSVILLAIKYKMKKTIKHEHGLTGFDILNQLPCHVYWKNKEGVRLGCNTVNWKDFKLDSLNDFIGKNDYEVFPNDEAEKMCIIDNRIMKTGEAEVIEEICTGINGKATYLSHKTPLKDKSDKTIGILGVSIDITERSKAVIQKIQTLESIMKATPGNIYWLDEKGVYQGCNENQARRAGFDSCKEMVGKKNIDLKGCIHKLVDANNKLVMETRKPITIEETSIRNDGTITTYLSTKVPRFNSDNKVIGIVGVSIDITERKKQEEELKNAKSEAENSNKIKSEFISNMEHDIRTPFVGIYGMLNLLAEQETDKTKKNILCDVASCAKELMDYCDGVVDFSKIESKSLPMVNRHMNIRDLLNSVIKIESIAAKNKNIELSLECDTNLPLALIGDPYRLKRSLINLLSNAIKFTNEGFVRLSARLESADVDKRKAVVAFSVEDSGIGIPDDKKELIYERFTKVEPSNKGLYRGLGLGLRIVKQFLDELDGDIQLKTEVGKGSKFVIFLPFKIPLSKEIIDNNDVLV